MGARLFHLKNFPHILPKADIVLCATGASHFVIQSDDVQRSIHQRMNRPMFLIDISVPRNIDPAVKDVDNAFLFDIDDLKSHVGQNQEERRKEAEKAEAMVTEEVTSMQFGCEVLRPNPPLWRFGSEQMRSSGPKLKKVLSRFENLSPKERQAIEGLASAIVNKLLHGPLVTLKSEAQSNNGFAFIEVARRFFDLPDSSLISDLDLLYQEQGESSEQNNLHADLQETADSETIRDEREGSENP